MQRRGFELSHSQKAAGHHTWTTDFERCLVKMWAQNKPLLWKSHPIQGSRGSSLQLSNSIFLFQKCANNSCIPYVLSPPFSSLHEELEELPTDILFPKPAANWKCRPGTRERRKSQVLVNFNSLTHLGIFLHIATVELTVAMARPTRTTPKSLGSRNLFPYR